MSGNHKRKRRNWRREQRHKALGHLMLLLAKLGLRSLHSKGSVHKNIWWEYVCRFDKMN